MPEPTYEEVTGYIQAVTDKAILLINEVDLEEHWIPKSVIASMRGVEEGKDASIEVETWFVEKESIEV